MKFTIMSALFFITAAFAADPNNTIVLDETGVKNLRIQTAIAEESDFAETVFAIGRIEPIPGKTAAVSSRISGRITGLSVSPGDTVTAGQEVAKIESRQPGNPPPTIGLTAPIGGFVTEVYSRLGDPAEPDKALLEIIDLSQVDAHARVPEHQAGRMKIGAKAHIRVAALPDQTFEGELLRFGTSADSKSGTIDAVFRIPNKDGLIRPEMRAEFSIIINERKNVLSVPRAALQGEASNRHVYVKDFDLPNAFIKTPVQVGEMNDRSVEIIAGLFPADEVVTQGAYSLGFAGGGTISLKDALDAAHGHEHAADGSELGDSAKKEPTAEVGDHGHEDAGSSPLWKIISGVLFLLLLASLFSRFKSTPNPEAR